MSEAQARARVAERAYYGGIAYLNDCLANAREYRAARERGARRLAKSAVTGD
ncbi:MAG TPA: hypothetical protein VFL91_21760 [Thermomicrobiales bacterium]|nr:hypothetical protein [Thermomicrobiales bacterium]